MGLGLGLLGYFQPLDDMSRGTASFTAVSMYMIYISITYKQNKNKKYIYININYRLYWKSFT